MRTLSTSTTALFVLGVSGCADLTETPFNETELESQSQALYGALTTHDCTTQQRDTIISTHQSGMKMAMSDAFDSCVHQRVYATYRPCLEGNRDPFWGSPTLEQYERARDIMRSGNTASVDVWCATLGGGVMGRAGIEGYGDTNEVLQMDRGWLDDTGLNGISDWERAGVASVIWHEAMHQQGYSHGSENCGYPQGQYDRGLNSMNAITDQCMYAAGTAGRITAFSGGGSTGVPRMSQSLGVGRHFASRGDLSVVGNDVIDTLTLSPAMRVRHCRDEAGNDGTTCATFDNLTAGVGAHTAVGPGISFVEVQPLVVLSNVTQYRGAMQGLAYGEYRASDLGTVGNDQTQSIYVAPGTRVRVCTDDGGPSGHGTGTCAVYSKSVPQSALVGISYAEVQPVVTAFSENDGYGSSASFGPGRWVGSLLEPLGDNRIRSLVIPYGMTARACSEAGANNEGAGICTVFDFSVFNLQALAGTVSFLEVSPGPLGTYGLQVQRPSTSAPTRVTSTPLGISCTGLCSYSFGVRTEVKLSAPAAGVAPEWTGCDRVSGRDCFVTMMSNRTVTVNFPTRDAGCYRECFDECISSGDMTTRQCVQMCTRACTN